MSEELTNVTSAPVETAESGGPVEALTAENSLKDAIAEKVEAEGANLEAANEAAEPEKDQFASKFAALSRKEKEIRQKEREIAEKLSEYDNWKKEQEELANKKEPEVPLDYRLKKDPLSTLAEMGLSYEKLTELALNDGKLTTDMQMELMKRELEEKYSSGLEELKNELAERDKKAEEQKYQETISSFMNELTDFVNTNEKYDLIRAGDAVEEVYKIIEEHYNKTNEVLSNAEAADMLQSHLEKELEAMLEKTASRYGYSKAQPKPEQKTVTQSPTLSNSQTSHVSTQGSTPLSEEESRAAAAQLIKWHD